MMKKLPTMHISLSCVTTLTLIKKCIFFSHGFNDDQYSSPPKPKAFKKQSSGLQNIVASISRQGKGNSERSKLLSLISAE